MYSARTYTHQRDKILISKEIEQSLVGLHLSCFNILLSCGRFIITIIPTCLSENWFYATRLNGVLRKKKNHHIGWNKNRKRNNKQVRWRCKWRIYLSSVESSGEWKIYIHWLVCHWKGADENRLWDKYCIVCIWRNSVQKLDVKQMWKRAFGMIMLTLPGNAEMEYKYRQYTK